MKFLPYVLRNLRRNKLRSLLTVMAIGVCLMLMTFLYGYLERRAPQVVTEIRDKKEISDTLRESLTKAISDARTEFVAAKGIKAA